jgi:hypothetical protein
LPLASPCEDPVNRFVPSQNIDWYSENMLTSLSRGIWQLWQSIHFPMSRLNLSDVGQLRLLAISASIAIANDRKSRGYESLGVLTKVIYVDSAYTA